jgi:competence protein ComEA
VGAPASDLRFAVERCTTAVEIDGWLHCDRDPVPLAEPVPVGRRVDGRGRPRGPDGWLPGAAFEALALPVDVESADVERLASLPGIGPRRAAEIVARRPLGGRAALDDLPGIGPATWARLRTRVRFAPALRTPAPPTAVTPGAARRR